MLCHLYVKNFILIDEADLDFDEGFSVFTGETGAGKSILIDAISLLCGQRAQAGFVQKGKAKAVIEGLFDFTGNPEAAAMLKEDGIEDLEEVFIRREITAEGKSQMRLNHRVTTVNWVKELLSHEIDIHSQHDTQYLLNPSSFLKLLDQYVNEHELAEQVADSYHILHSLQQQLMEMESPKAQQDLEFLHFQVNEIAEAHLKPGEDEELEELEKKIAVSEKLAQRISGAVEVLDGDSGVISSLYEVTRSLSGFSDQSELSGILDSLNEQYYALQDSSERLNDFFASLDFSEEQINEVQSRLFDINRLKRKYGRTIEDILQKADEYQQLIDQQENREQLLEQLQKQVKKAEKDFCQKADLYHQHRAEKALKLEKEVEHHLKDLMLPHARFKIQLSQAKPTSSGTDVCDFMISMNPGEPLRSLATTASGGELSRLMLGLKTIFTHLEGIQTVIFDEIDTGVSGQAATAIGLKMSLLGKDAQVFSVTHLAQVASCADRHYHVTKHQTDESTQTRIHCLDKEQRILQLAMIAQGEASDTAVQAAREMYDRNQKKVKEAR